MKTAGRTRLAVTAACALAAGVAIAAAWAADAKLDQADDFLTKAEALVKAAADPGARLPFGGHAAKAAALIEQARTELVAAKQSADSHK